MALKTDYKNFIPDENGRRYSITQDAQGYTKINDETTYLQQGDNFGANDMNATNYEINKMNSRTIITLPAEDPEDSPYTEETDSDSNTYYTIEIPVAGMTSEYVGVSDAQPVLPTTYNVNQEKAIKKLFSLIRQGESMSGKIKLFFTKKPTQSFQIYLYGV